MNFMCGIVGFTSKEKNLKKIESFTKEISHRGPDSLGFKIYKVGEAYLHLGSSRLAIRGDKRENMPMESEGGNSIIYNGEIFDLNILDQYLERNDYIGDTRILLDLLSKNIEHVSKVNGMFAFGFYEKEKDKLHLSRDKLGIKPLFYSLDQNKDIIFSSEINSLIKFSNSSHSIKKDELNKLFYFGGLTQNSNIIQNINILNPGELISYDIKDKKIQSKKSFKDFKNYSLDNISFKNLLTSTLKDHLIADKQVDILLSGGLDSSILAYISKKYLDKELNHYSLIFDEKSYSEEENINLISNKLSLESKIFTFNKSDIDKNVSEAINNMNSLVLDYSFVPSFILSRKTSLYTKAVISGDGADELFGGYEWYRGIKFFQMMPYSFKKIVKKIIESLDFPTEKYGYLNFYTKLNYFFKHLVNDPFIQMIIWQSSLSSFNKKDIENISKEISQYINKSNSLNENYRNIDLNFFLFSNVLPKIDVASMANGLEIRPPFLDDRIVQFAIENKTNDVNLVNTKLYLRNFIKGTEIEFINKTKKHGFGFPLLEWLMSSGFDEIKTYYEEDKLIINDQDKENISLALKSKTLTPNVGRELWSYYVISKWAEKNNLNLT